MAAKDNEQHLLGVLRPLEVPVGNALLDHDLRLSPNVAVHPLRPATDRRLGKPLPYQLANQTRIHLFAIAFSEAIFPYKAMRLHKLMRY